MGFFATGIIVFVQRTDSQGRKSGETTMVLKEGKKDGVYLVNTSAKGNPIVKTFSPVGVDVFNKWKNVWFLEIRDADGSTVQFKLRNEADGRSMAKRISKHLV